MYLKIHVIIYMPNLFYFNYYFYTGHGARGEVKG